MFAWLDMLTFQDMAILALGVGLAAAHMRARRIESLLGRREMRPVRPGVGEAQSYNDVESRPTPRPGMESYDCRDQDVPVVFSATCRCNRCMQSTWEALYLVTLADLLAERDPVNVPGHDWSSDRESLERLDSVAPVVRSS